MSMIGGGGSASGGGGPTGLPRNYIDGLVLSWSSGTVLGIAAGTCDDSTHAVVITGTAFTKSISGLFAAGTGANGMGGAIIVAANTWYHVFAIVVGGSYDVYFDTSPSAANKPAGTTSFRRIGSFKTDGSSAIVKFFQLGEEFAWDVPFNEWDDVNPGNAAVLKTLVGVPTGLKVTPRLGVSFILGASKSMNVLFTGADQTDTTPSGTARSFFLQTSSGSGTTSGMTVSSLLTNTSAQIRYRLDAGTSGVEMVATTWGWKDLRGKDGP